MARKKNLSRLFFALLPGDEVRQKLKAVSLALPDKAGRKIPPENFHITLIFLGNVEHGAIDKLRASCASIRVKPFELRIDHAGWWKKSGILWLGPASAEAELLQLSSALNQLALKQGLLDGFQKIRPHITMMRKVSESVSLPEFQSFVWPVYEFCLMESLPRAGGVEYKPIETWPLW